MPLYEYRCLTCEHTFEAIQKFSDDPLNECPECGKEVAKCVSTPAIQFKGSGFYITDYTDKSGAKSDKTVTPKGGGKVDTKTDTKSGGGSSGSKGSTGSGASKASTKTD